MAADLQIHIADALTDDDLRCFFSSHLDSSWFDWDGFKEGKPVRNECEEPFCAHWDAFHDTPSTWIGAVSWLKAALTDDTERYVPGTVERIAAMIDDRATVVIDAEFITEVGKAFEAPNNTYYSLADRDGVVAWLESHKGSRVIDVSW